MNFEDLHFLKKPALIANNSMNLGLGNRIRFTLSCQSIAESEGRNFYYYWPVGSDFGARFHELWHYQENELNSPGPKPYIPQWSSCMTDLGPFRGDSVLSLVGSQVVKGFGGEESWESKFRKLHPVSEISSAAEDILSNILGPFVGVQVRAAEKSHAKTLEHSPVSWYIERMLQIYDSYDGGVRFFLSCDNYAAENLIISSVPGVVSAGEKGNYNSREALVGSVIDLLVLSKSNYLLGPYMSSFVYLAWVLSGYSQDLETSQGIRKKR